MNPSTPKTLIITGNEDDSPASSLRRIVRKSALLNLVIVLTSLPVLVLAGGPNAVVPSLVLMVAITFLIWSATFMLYSCVSVGRIFWKSITSVGRRKPPGWTSRAGMADRWLDGPG